jgi:hypothetical protein
MTVTDDGRTTYGCNPRARCSASQNAWVGGCRHPGAIEAHERWKADRRAARAAAANWPPGQCLARSHGTRYAAQINGCRCVDALVRMEEVKRGRDASVRKRWRERAYALECAQKEAQIRRATGGRLGSDPRQEWRYGKAGVSSITVMMMLHGFPDAPNRAERMVAIIRLESQRVRDERTSRMRPLFDSEIGERIGCSDATVTRLRAERRRRRDQRTLRRLADVQWRAAHHAHGAERRPRP